MVKIKINELKAHPFNKIFGDLPEEEFEALKNDIQIRGMQSNIDITEDNVIVCGHQRVKACKQLGLKEVEARVLKGWNDDQVKQHLILDNILRRQLTNLQRAGAARELLPIEQRMAKERMINAHSASSKLSDLEVGKSYDKVAKLFNTSENTLRRDIKVLEKLQKLGRKDLIEAEKQGHKTVTQIIKEDLAPLEEPCDEPTQAELTEQAIHNINKSLNQVIETIDENIRHIKKLSPQDENFLKEKTKDTQEKLIELYKKIEGEDQ